MADDVPVVAYGRGTPEQITQQHQACRAAAERHGQVVVALASDSGDATDGWRSANRMVEDGTAAGIRVVSKSVIPDVESVTSEIPNTRRPRRLPGAS